MLSSITKKNKINLDDYNYQRDIENRLLMSHFSVFEVEVLEEIINGSITMKISDLTDALDVSVDTIMPIIEDLKTTGLFVVKDDKIVVNKELRKYYEFQIEKFDDDFRPDMEFLQDLHSKVPIHVLPVWYSIPRTSDNIFKSLIERYLLTPSIYQRYLGELNFTDPTVSGIVEDVFSSPDKRVFSSELRERYSLSLEQFEEHMLHLEFNIVCCLVYVRVGKEWKEIVTPFYEWKELLSSRKERIPTTIVDGVVKTRDNDFAFLEDMEKVIAAVKKDPITLEEDAPTEDTVKTLMLRCDIVENINDKWKKYFKEMVDKLLILKLVKRNKDTITLCEGTEEWLAMSLEEQGCYLLKNRRNTFVTVDIDKKLYADKNQRHLERSLAAVADLGWIYFDDFIASMEESIGTTDSVMLKRRGRRWKYTFPHYTAKEQDFIRAAIQEKLFEVGFVATGTHNDKPCLRVTTFGKSCIVKT